MGNTAIEPSYVQDAAISKNGKRAAITKVLYSNHQYLVGDGVTTSYQEQKSSGERNNYPIRQVRVDNLLISYARYSSSHRTPCRISTSLLCCSWESIQPQFGSSL
jgi:hypothetical protein